MLSATRVVSGPSSLAACSSGSETLISLSPSGSSSFEDVTSSPLSSLADGAGAEELGSEMGRQNVDNQD